MNNGLNVIAFGGLTMTLEIGLLVLESILLIGTFTLLIFNIRERKQRDILLREVGRATRVPSRQEYFLSLMDSMLEAKKELIGCITGRSPSGDDIKTTNDIVDAIENIAKKGVRIKYLLPKFPDRLRMGVRYMKAGAEVLFSNCLMAHNIRYSIIDERIVVLGIPESAGEKETTKEGYKIMSVGLALILKDSFDACEKQASLKDYLQEVIEQTGATLAYLARELSLDEEDLKKI